MMPYEDFRRLVRKMMDAQQDYFRTKDKKLMIHAKQIEATVRKELDEDTKPKLF